MVPSTQSADSTNGARAVISMATCGSTGALRAPGPGPRIWMVTPLTRAARQRPRTRWKGTALALVPLVDCTTAQPLPSNSMRSLPASPGSARTNDAMASTGPGTDAGGGLVVWEAPPPQPARSTTASSIERRRIRYSLGRQQRRRRRGTASSGPAGSVQLGVDPPRRLGGNAGHSLELLGRGAEHALGRAEVLEQRPPPHRSHPVELVEHRGARAAITAEAVEADREPVGLVTHPLQQPQTGRVVGQNDGVGTVGHEHLLDPLGQCDHRHPG